MSSVSIAPGSIVVIHKDVVAKNSLQTCVAIVKSNDEKGNARIRLAFPITKQKCDSCKGDIRYNHTHGLGTCRSCNRRFGVKATRTTMIVPENMIREIVHPEDN